MTTQRLVPEALVCVPASQEAEYRAVTPHVVTHPDEIIGLTPKLNWMLEHLADADGIVLLDDDIAAVVRTFTTPEEVAARRVTDPRDVESIIWQTFELARDLGAFYFGWDSSEASVRYYSGHRPFALTGFINGCSMGFRAGHGLRFDERICAKNDYDVAALNAYRHRICLRDLRYAFCQTATFTGAGGQSFYRNSETEQRDVAILREKYGGVITGGGFGGMRRRHYAGAQKIGLKLPF